MNSGYHGRGGGGRGGITVGRGGISVDTMSTNSRGSDDDRSGEFTTSGGRGGNFFGRGGRGGGRGSGGTAGEGGGGGRGGGRLNFDYGGRNSGRSSNNSGRVSEYHRNHHDGPPNTISGPGRGDREYHHGRGRGGRIIGTMGGRYHGSNNSSSGGSSYGGRGGGRGSSEGGPPPHPQPQQQQQQQSSTTTLSSYASLAASRGQSHHNNNSMINKPVATTRGSYSEMANSVGLYADMVRGDGGSRQSNNKNSNNNNNNNNSSNNNLGSYAMMGVAGGNNTLMVDRSGGSSLNRGLSTSRGSIGGGSGGRNPPPPPLDRLDWDHYNDNNGSDMNHGSSKSGMQPTSSFGGPLSDDDDGGGGVGRDRRRQLSGPRIDPRGPPPLQPPPLSDREMTRGIGGSSGDREIRRDDHFAEHHEQKESMWHPPPTPSDDDQFGRHRHSQGFIRGGGRGGGRGFNRSQSLGSDQRRNVGGGGGPTGHNSLLMSGRFVPGGTPDSVVNNRETDASPTSARREGYGGNIAQRFEGPHDRNINRSPLLSTGMSDNPSTKIRIESSHETSASRHINKETETSSTSNGTNNNSRSAPTTRNIQNTNNNGRTQQTTVNIVPLDEPPPLPVPKLTCPPSPPPAAPSAYALALIRMVEMNADMEFAYARLMMLDHEQRRVKARLDTLESMQQQFQGGG